MDFEFYNDLWKKVESLSAITWQINEQFNTKYEQDLLSMPDIDRKVVGVKSVLVDKVIKETLKENEWPNVKIDSEMIESLERAPFDPKYIYKTITDTYTNDANSIAFEQLKELALRLIPNVRKEDGYGYRPPTIDDIVKGRQLRLRVYLSYGYIDWQKYEQICALEKIIRMQFTDTSAANVKPLTIATLLEKAYRENHADYSQVKKYDYHYAVNGSKNLIESFRLYKNGRFDITFTKKNYARMIAEALLS